MNAIDERRATLDSNALDSNAPQATVDRQRLLDDIDTMECFKRRAMHNNDDLRVERLQRSINLTYHRLALLSQ